MIARLLILAGAVLALMLEGLLGLVVFASVFGTVFGLIVLAHRAWHQ